MASEFVFEFLALVAVDPAEEFGIVWRAGTIGDAVGPVLGETMFFGETLETRVGDGELHDHVRLCGLLVVPPQCREWLLNAALTWN